MTTRSRPLGISSGSLPTLSATQLAATVERLGGTAVDLRWGKGHAWESEGLAPFDAAGLEVTFIGIGLALGRGDAIPAEIGELAPLLRHRPPIALKTFAAVELGEPGDLGRDSRALAAAQAARLHELGQTEPLVETHHGYASIANLDRLCAEAGCHLLLDVFGLYRLTGQDGDPTGTVQRWTRAAQVKGFTATPEAEHRPLTEMPKAAWRLLDELDDLTPVTVESKAGTLEQDLAALRDWDANRDRTLG